MDFSSFRFTMTMPGDARLVTAVRELTAYAAKYARLGEPAGSELADQVARVAEASIAVTGGKDRPIEFQFARDEDRLEVRIAFDVDGAGSPATTKTADGVSVQWSREDGRHVCLIGRRASARS
jgi:hypothetical protein